MNKKLILLLSGAFLIGGLNINPAECANVPFGYDLQKDMHREKRQPKSWEVDSNTAQNSGQNESGEAQEVTVNTSDDVVFLKKYDQNPKYYPNATVKSAVSKYKSGNYTGSLQELFAILKKDPNNALAYYYLGMVYTKLGEKESAMGAYQRAIDISPDNMLVNYATRGKACINSQSACTMSADVTETTGEALDDLDKFIRDSNTNGFSKELNQQLRDKQLQNIQNKMNKGLPLSEEDLKKLEEYNKTEGIKTDRLAMAADIPSNDEIINAVQVLKRAGLNISTQMPDYADETPAAAAVQPAQPSMPQTANYYTPDPQIQQMSMMLNNGNNNYNSDPMMNMIPYMMQNNGQNVDPQVIQAMMMNSMMNSLNGLNSNNNNN